MKDLLIVVSVVVVIGGIYFGGMKLYNFLVKTREAEDQTESGGGQRISTTIIKDLHTSATASIIIQAGSLLLSILAFFFEAWFSSVGILVFFGISLWMSFFRVKDVFVASPSSFFTGRLRRTLDENQFSIPIHKPYREGLHYKPFWWIVEPFKRDVKQLVIDRQEYQIGSGGTILVSGIVQYRVSDIATYRAAEIGEDQVKAGLGSEVDQFIIKELGNIESNMSDIDKDGKVDVDTGIDYAIQTRAQLSKKMETFFKSTILGDKKDPNDEALEDVDSETRELIERELFGRCITYTEQGYGVEVLTARIDKVDPVASIKKERDRIQEERYQTRSETIQVNHFLNRVKEVHDKFGEMDEEISPEKAVEIVQLSMKLTTKEIKELQVSGVEGLVAEMFAKWQGGAK